MKPKTQRLIFILIAFCSVSLGTTLILKTFTENILFFVSPTELNKNPAFLNKEIRLGGLVKEGSVKKTTNGIEFALTDLAYSVNVSYQGIIPNLFREGQGMVARGKMNNNLFIASEILAKHDENYMPKEVVESLKKSGNWREPEKKVIK